MHLEFFVEEPSMEEALKGLIPVLVSNHTWRIHVMGNKQRLLSLLPQRLQAVRSFMSPDYRIVVLVDEDGENCKALKQQLLDACAVAGLPVFSSASTDSAVRGVVLLRIVIEELEAWYFGDMTAVSLAYRKPAMTKQAGKRAFRNPDAIQGGTWERFEQLCEQHGVAFGKKDAARRGSVFDFV